MFKLKFGNLKWLRKMAESEPEDGIFAMSPKSPRIVTTEEDMEYWIKNKETIVKRIGETRYEAMLGQLRDHIANRKIK